MKIGDLIAHKNSGDFTGTVGVLLSTVKSDSEPYDPFFSLSECSSGILLIKGKFSDTDSRVVDRVCAFSEWLGSPKDPTVWNEKNFLIVCPLEDPFVEIAISNWRVERYFNLLGDHE